MGPDRIDLEEAYGRAFESALAVEFDPPGVLLARGADVIDFLQRMSTNDMAGLAPGQIRGTILTNAIGRVVDRIEVTPLDDGIAIVTSPGEGQVVRAWLSRYIFFQDDVALAEPDEPFHEWGVFGPSAEDGMQHTLGFPTGTAAGASRRLGGGFAWRVEKPVPGFRILADPATHQRCLAAWGGCGPGSVAFAAFEALRIEHGCPAPGREITHEVIPLEIDLWEDVNFEKGCYIGQEVIARMESRGRIARRLVGVQLDQWISLPQELTMDSGVIGSLTSAAESPAHGPIALALVRTADEPLDGRVATCRPSGVAATLRSLPF
jgi:folate-binding protein YgfZ